MSTTLRELATLFLRLGATSFGGPAAHVAMMEDEVVRRRGWLSREAFLELYGAAQLIPGPNSTELAIHVGYARARWAGLVVAGACFILPAMLIVWAVAWAYVRFGTLPAVGAVLLGIKPVVLAIVLQALLGFARTALTSAITLSIAGLSLVALAMGMHEVAVLLLAGAFAWLDWRLTRGGNLWEPEVRALVPLVPLASAPSASVALAGAPGAARAAGGAGATALLAMGGGSAAATAFSLGKLFALFLKSGALLFGSGYVLLAFLRNDFVTRAGWLTESQLLDAIAVGQFTPGPVFTTATFVGYVLGGHAGALLATVGIFLPAFLFVALTAPLLARLRTAPGMRAALSGLNAASLALMAAVSIPLARDAFPVLDGRGPATGQTLLAVALFAAAAFLLHRRMNSAWLVLGGGIAGWAAVTVGLAAVAGPV